MTDDHKGEAGAGEQLFQPQHPRHVEVVGGLVHHHQIRLVGQGAANGQPFAPAAGKIPHPLADIGEPADPGQTMGRGIGLFRGQGVRGRREQGVFHRCRVVEAVVLGEIGEAHPLADKDLTAIGLLKPAENLHEGGFPRPIGADEPQTLAAGEAHGDPGEEMLGPKGLGDGLTTGEM